MSGVAEQAVLRMFLDDHPEGVLGTAFVVAPGLALTCAHVLEGLEGRTISLTGRCGQFSVCGSARLPPDLAATDLALLPVDAEAPPLLACALSTDPPRRIEARGYSPVVTGPGGRELRFAPRDRIQARYYEGTRSYLIEDAFDLVGDPAEKGYSGSPLIDSDGAAVVGVLSGGDHGRERSWAVPLHAAAQTWPELAEALAWNDSNLPRYGMLANRIGALEVCRAQVRREIARMRDIKKYDPAMSVARTSVAEILRQFRGEPATALAIVDGSNTGKTWLLCDAAKSPILEPILLLAAAELPANDPPSLQDFLARELQAAWGNQARDTLPPSPLHLAKVLNDISGSLTIALDGVNEALDVRHFLGRWLPEAMAWCRDSAVKLVLTTRPEAWPAIARASPSADILFHWKPSGATGAYPSPPSVQRCVLLNNFTHEEAEDAVRKYRIDLDVADALGRHPLLFRVAAKLRLNATAARVGRYRLLDHFAEQQIGDATDRKAACWPSELALERIKRLAGALSAAEGGSMTSDAAVRILSDEEMLFALTEAGLLSRYGGSVRFTYDQVGEVMTPAPATPAALFPPEELADRALFRRSVVGLLRLEANENEAGFASGLARLRAVLTDAAARTADWWDILESLAYLILSLPSSRAAEIEAILALATDSADEIARVGAFSRLVTLVEEAPLTTSRQCEILLSLAPWGDAFPFRHQDWVDESRRRHFDAKLQDEDDSNVASALNRLHLADRDGVRPFLVRALSDETHLDKGPGDDCRNEASIASLSAGVLFHGRMDSLEGLLDLLIPVQTNSGYFLLSALAAELPEQLFSFALAYASDRRAGLFAVRALTRAIPHLEPGIRVRAIPVLETLLIDPGEVGRAAASVLREISPDHLAAWDRIAEAWPHEGSTGHELHPVPAARFGRALVLAQAHPKAALEWMSANDGNEDQQIAMVELATKLLEAGAVRLFSCGRLVEDKLNLFRLTDSDRFRPWLSLARRLTQCHDVETRRCLIYAVFGNRSRLSNPNIAELAEMLYRQDLSESEICTITDKILSFLPEDRPLWRGHFARVRLKHRHAADLQAIFSVPHHHPDVAEAVVSFWRSLGESERSGLAAKVLMLLDDGETSSSVFGRDWREIAEAGLAQSRQ